MDEVYKGEIPIQTERAHDAAPPPLISMLCEHLIGQPDFAKFTENMARMAKTGALDEGALEGIDKRLVNLAIQGAKLLSDHEGLLTPSELLEFTTRVNWDTTNTGVTTPDRLFPLASLPWRRGIEGRAEIKENLINPEFLTINNGERVTSGQVNALKMAGSACAGDLRYFGPYVRNIIGNLYRSIRASHRHIPQTATQEWFDSIKDSIPSYATFVTKIETPSKKPPSPKVEYDEQFMYAVAGYSAILLEPSINSGQVHIQAMPAGSRLIQEPQIQKAFRMALSRAFLQGVPDEINELTEMPYTDILHNLVSCDQEAKKFDVERGIEGVLHAIANKWGLLIRENNLGKANEEMLNNVWKNPNGYYNLVNNEDLAKLCKSGIQSKNEIARFGIEFFTALYVTDPLLLTYIHQCMNDPCRYDNKNRRTISSILTFDEFIKKPSQNNDSQSSGNIFSADYKQPERFAGLEEILNKIDTHMSGAMRGGAEYDKTRVRKSYRESQRNPEGT